MTTVTLAEAQARLPELIAGLGPGEEVVITRETEAVAKLVAEPAARKNPRLGTAKGKILFMADDFDAPLEDFKEYMQ